MSSEQSTNGTERSGGIRDRPRFDRSHWPQTWIQEWRVQVADLFCGRGGVGRALDKWFPRRMYFGVDIQPYGDEYPGQFIQADLLADGGPPLDDVVADVVWVSWPCTAYSSLSATYYGSAEAALDENPRITDEFREWLLDHAGHYIIENVPGATKAGDLDANCRCNGLFFGEDFDLERHFETTFEVPDAYVDGDASVTVDTREDQSVAELAEAKGVPKEWGKQAVRSAIPWQYVWWLLSHCPSIPCPVPRMEQRSLGEFSGEGVGCYRKLPGDRLGGTDVAPGDGLYSTEKASGSPLVVADGGRSVDTGTDHDGGGA